MLKINKKLLMDVVIASVVVRQVPELLAKFGISFGGGMTDNVVGGVGGYVVGMILKNPNVQTIALGVAGADLVNDLVGDTIQNLLPGGAHAKSNENMQDYLQLAEYVDRPAVDYSYADFYKN